MKKSTVVLLACAILALPAAAEITAKKERVGGSQNLDVIRLDGTTLFGSAQDVLGAAQGNDRQCSGGDGGEHPPRRSGRIAGGANL